MGQILGSIGEDQKFKLWQEDVYEPPCSGHRFKCIFTVQSSSRIPYVSFDFKTVGYSNVHVALLSRDALLTVYEANEPESMTSWAVVDQFHVCAPPGRGEETSFRARYDQNALPCWTACRAGLPEDALSLVTAGMTTAKIWRTDVHRHYYLAVDLSSHHPHHGLVRDVAWAPLNVRGWDIIATTCTDGYIRIFEIHTPLDQSPTSLTSLLSPYNATNTAMIDTTISSPTLRRPFIGGNSPFAGSMRSSSSASQHHQRISGIGAELAGTFKGHPAGPSTSSTRRPQHRHRRSVDDGHDQETNEGQVMHTVKEIATIKDQYGGVWQAEWRSTGERFISVTVLPFWLKPIIPRVETRI